MRLRKPTIIVFEQSVITGPLPGFVPVCCLSIEKLSILGSNRAIPSIETGHPLLNQPTTINHQRYHDHDDHRPDHRTDTIISKPVSYASHKHDLPSLLLFLSVSVLFVLILHIFVRGSICNRNSKPIAQIHAQL